MSEVRTDFTGDTSSLQDAAGKAQKAIDGVAASGETASKKLDKGLKAAGDAAGKLGGNAQKLSGVFSKLSPAAGGAAGALADVGDVFEVGAGAAGALGLSAATAGVALGALAVAGGAIYLAYRKFNHETEVANELMAIHKLGVASQVGLDRDLRVAKLDLAVATHELTVQEAQYQKIAFGSEAAIEAALKPLKDQEKALKSSQGTWTQWGKDVGGVLVESLAGKYWYDATAGIDENSAAIEANAEEQRDVIAKGKQLRVTLQEVDKELGNNKTATDAAAEATRKATQDLEDHDAMMQRLEDRRKADVKAEEDHQREIQAAIDDGVQAEVDAANWAAAQVGKAEDEKTAKIKKTTEELRAQVKTITDVASSSVDAVFGLIDQLNDQALDAIDTTTEAGKKAAKEQWEANHAAAIAMAAVQAALAIVQAIASAPPPYNIPAIIASTIQGGIAVAAVAAVPPPKFAGGGFPDAATTGTPAILHPEEAVLSQQGRRTMGDQAIRDANAGRGGGARTLAVTVYKHKSFDYFVADNLLTNGPLAQTMRRGDRVGQIRRGRA